MFNVAFKAYSNTTSTNPQKKQPKQPQSHLKSHEGRDTVNFGVRLRTGVDEPDAIVTVVIDSLGQLLKEGLPGFNALHDLTQKIRNPRHQIPTSSAKKLKTAGLLEDDGTVQNSVGNVVKAATEQDGNITLLVNPFKN